MMGSVIEYKGYHSKVEYDAEDNILVGKIEGINDLVTFEADSIETVKKEFREAVEDYLAFCKEVGKEPEKEYKGSFNIRIDSELHRRLHQRALKDNMSLNAATVKAIEAYVSAKDKRAVTENNIIIYPQCFRPQSDYSRNTQPMIKYNPNNGWDEIKKARAIN